MVISEFQCVETYTLACFTMMLQAEMVQICRPKLEGCAVERAQCGVQ